MPGASPPTRQELLERFRPRNLRRSAHGEAVTYDCTVPAHGGAGHPDQVVRRQVLARRLCGLCGDLLGDEVAFIGTPSQAHRQRFSLPGLHVDCARFALCAIPLFAEGLPGRSSAGFVRGEELVLYICPGYAVSRAALICVPAIPASRLDAVSLIRAQPANRVERHRGWDSMAAVITAHGGCPAHDDPAITGCAEHRELLSPTERRRIAELSDAAASESTARATNMRELFAPRNLRIEANGFPLTFDNAVKADGTAELSTDLCIERRLLRRRRCLVCADDLGSEVAFIGTTLAADAGWFPTPGMHVDCARFAFSVCPFIARPDWDRPITHTLQHIRSDEMVLVVAESYSYSPWRWWWALKILGPYRRANFGSARPHRVFHEERHPGRREMVAYLNAQGGCPAHREQALTASLAHTAGAGRRSVVQ